MTRISNETLIVCPPDFAFDYVVNMNHEVEWNTSAESMRKLTSGPVGLGTRYRAKWKQAKAVDVEITEFDRPHRWVVEVTSKSPVNVRVEGRVTEDGDGCRLRFDFDADPNGWFRLIYPMFVGAMRRQWKANMVNVKSVLEAKCRPTRYDIT